ncbi:bifunctional 4-hydroxy-2-oxoglutarate aldolase/2-dehydro-3-deoxy-phosphogluconate aldolase [Vibrio fluvialis]|uniref:bifunctional 4-hydroxy-2-oxoglutarate aldolase/2-dehydro-3-deoxy-phosphogluconate aldolase n=1 Tax=Vibrio sp. bablab_jr001 TaxID=2755067 RepID=UPI0018F24F79|nr:bifunctional 4-hydroxy-2-oxoglutarate aldolase/2-dehydro-3-deoxy-phosphogluconate aldolase [Vibrio sp. bablab_jr001]EKO3399377.1 bifunctional 4-hydroxy-2-oxoglutarate aldolase/2-dehydro-3-deoxy-phosphogluconate aldolase [Vibrio fluvialis]EKO3473344.1 bifunctional 4-hydroxy-2-oxoglutarate aldolase/2-dehydro-3-deoxy-phosphogluconate aldolase [Vibrio fluvialis]MBY8115788.1 bifunctional 4-hydroxy-2-oxoglutarate aldolase/2-dehydro-3-deoxy-phosphogluconate aldolase [Vibrio fluvialis]MBY8248993.1 b
MTLEQRLQQIKIVPVIAINDAEHAVPLAKVLVENGLPCAEVTFRTDAAQESIRLMRDAYPKLLIGAGTVLTTQQVDQAISAGADFIVSPGLNPTTVKYCQQRGIAIVPGVNNPSLVEQAMELGLKTLKFFPAEPSGGVAMLKALSAVYPVQFMPTGGVNPRNVADYLALPSVVACGGTWMVPSDLMDSGNWDEIARLVREL